MTGAKLAGARGFVTRIWSRTKKNPLFPLTSCLLFVAMVFAFSQSPQLSMFSSYGWENPRAAGPAWEAAARKELSIRCATGYSSIVGKCTSFAGVMDSLYIRAAGFLLGRSPSSVIAQDPEFADPVLQWLLGLKRSILCALLLLGTHFFLSRILGDPFLSLLGLLAFAQTSGVRERAFSVGVDGEFGVGLLFLFVLLVYQEGYPKKGGFWSGMFTGWVGAIKSPCLLFGFLTINSVFSFLGFILAFGLMTAGFLRSSIDLLSPFSGLLSENGGGVPLTAQLILRNALSIVPGGFEVLIPFSCVGLYFLFKKSSPKSIWRYIFVIAYFVWSFFRADNEPGHFIGQSGIFMVLSLLCFSEGFAWARRHPQAVVRKLNLVPAVLSIAVFASIVWLDKWAAVSSFRAVDSYFRNGKVTEADLDKRFSGETMSGEITEAVTKVRNVVRTESDIVNEVKKGHLVYIDRRTRLNLLPLWAGPLKGAAHRVFWVDLFNVREIPAGTTLFTFCFDLSNPLAYGVGNFGGLADLMRAACARQNIASLQSVSDLQRLRLVPAFSSSSRVIRLEIGSRIQIQPASVTRKEFRLGGSFFRGELPSSMAKTLVFAKGSYLLRPDVASNYREPADLVLLVDGNQVGGCSLDTHNVFFNKYPLNLLEEADHRIFASKWINEFFQVGCQFPFSVDEDGSHSLEFQVKTKDPEGSAKIQDVLFRKAG